MSFAVNVKKRRWEIFEAFVFSDNGNRLGTRKRKWRLGDFRKINLCWFSYQKKWIFFDCGTFISVMFRTHVMAYYSLLVTQVRKRQTAALDCSTVQSKEQVGEEMSNSSFSSVSVAVFILFDISQSKLYFRLVALGSRLEKDEILVWYATQAWRESKEYVWKIEMTRSCW